MSELSARSLGNGSPALVAVDTAAEPLPGWARLVVLLGLWLLANVLASGLAALLLFPGLPFIHLFLNAGGLMGVFLLVALAGLPVAGGQALALRDRLPAPSRWARAITFGGFLGVAIGFFPSLALAETSPVVGLTVLGGVAGLVVGLAQARALPLRTLHALAWIATQGAGCAAAWWLGLGMLRWELVGDGASLADVGPLLVAGAVSGLVYGLITGPVLVAVLPPAQSRAPVATRPPARRVPAILAGAAPAYQVWERAGLEIALAGAALTALETHARYPWLREVAALQPAATDRRVTMLRLVTPRRRLVIAMHDRSSQPAPATRHRGPVARYHVFEWLAEGGATSLTTCDAAEIAHRFPPLAEALAGEPLVEFLVTTPGWLLTILPGDEV